MRSRIKPVVKGRLERKSLKTLFTINSDAIILIILIKFSIAYSSYLKPMKDPRIGVAAIPKKLYRLLFSIY